SRALTTFKTDPSLVPGRFNVLDINGVEVILDYGHNEAAMVALGQAVAGMGKRRTVMVICLPGDRRDRDLAATFSATFGFVDEYLLHDCGERRERQPNEVPHLLKARIPANVPCEIASNQEEGFNKGWRRVKP